MVKLQMPIKRRKHPRKNIFRVYSPNLGLKGFVFYTLTFVAGATLFSQAVYSIRLEGIFSTGFMSMMFGYVALYLHFNWEGFINKRKCHICGMYIDADWQCGLKLGKVNVCIGCVKDGKHLQQGSTSLYS